MKTKWKKLVEREADFWKNYMMISSVGDIKKVFDCTIKERLTTRKGMIFTHWLNPEAVWQTSLQIERKIKKSPNFINQVIKIFEKTKDNLLHISQEVEKMNFSNLSNQKSIKLYNQFCQAYKGLYAPFHLAVYIDSLEIKTKKWLLNELKKSKKEKKFDDYFIKLSTPQRLSLLQKEELNLLKIAIKVKEGNLNLKKLNKLMVNHTKRYAGLPVVNDETKPWSQKYFTQQLKKFLKIPKYQLLKEYDKLKNYSHQIKNEQDNIFNNFSAPNLIKKFFQFIGVSTWIRLVSRNTFALSHYFSKNLFKEIGRRLNLTAEGIKWFTPLEIKNSLINNQPLPPQKLIARKKVAVLLFRNKKFQIFEGEKAEKFITKELSEEFPISKGGGLKGTIAYLGKAKGLAKIILSQKDVSKMKKGDILVARMTTPELMPAIRKAAAIITDEGGITCHAAIISRELKIPCIVGTKFATKIFEDNDKIEVDANKGVIKKLN